MCPSSDLPLPDHVPQQLLHGPRLRLLGAMQSHPGPEGTHNEDVAAYVLPHPDELFARCGALALVADGMGGHQAGEIASSLAADIIRRNFYDLAGTVPEVLARCFEMANRAIYQRGASDAKCAGMGTTCTVIAVRDDSAYLAHIGDSRAYILRDGHLTRITQDHSVMAELVRKGTITESEAMHSPYRNLVFRALGSAPTAEPVIWSEGLKLRAHDAIILCSDGLSDLLEDDFIAEVAGTLPPGQACRALILAALEKGGRDNITLGVFTVHERSAVPALPEQPTRTIMINGSAGDGSAGVRHE
jgi:serine/threonine protein phosphatase PrpC